MVKENLRARDTNYLNPIVPALVPPVRTRHDEADLAHVKMVEREF